ncbi:hypothetical protein C922_00388 [Plasmodium inui San Antonio 1]|uniref:Centrosomal protein of 70 kDa n=1 Tax=Plasmodium inui San Antonio 1 TaxID=1237626 RepID=W7ACV6_9APIC|nr:hypothetical protein C922_00388 [Plasmodium inui San Antonio 1]EUD69525.1 hypothetical protein C922_00388 [Plasmodium inui San Antonio 1]
MSDDDFFQDKGSSSLQYIKCKTSTKIDDILKRRRNKLINGGDGERSREESPNEASSPKYNPHDGKQKEHHGEGSRHGNDERYPKWGEKSDSYHGSSSYQLEEVNKYLTKRHSHANLLDDEGELKLGRNYTQQRYSLGKKSFTEDSIKDIYSQDEKFRKGNIKSCINLSTFDDTKRSQLRVSKSLHHLNLQRRKKSSSSYLPHNGDETVPYAEDPLGGNLNNIYKTPSTEVLLREIRSKEDDDGNILHDGDNIEGEYQNGYDENREEIFANLNKIYLNDVDLNKTPSKSFSRNYFEYLKFETAGKMNMSELETPANLKDEKEEEGTNTPFITYYLAGKTSKSGLEQNVNLDYPCDDEKGEVVVPPGVEAQKGSTIYLPKEQRNILEELTLKGEQDKNGDSHFFTKEEGPVVSHLDGFKSILSNQGDDAQYRSRDKAGGESVTLLKLASSQKYNFVKTEAEYNDMLRERSNQLQIGKGSATTTGRIAESSNVNVLGNFVSNNNVSFNDNIFSSNQFHIMNTKSFRDNLFVDSKQCDRESTMPVQRMKHRSDTLPPGCELRRSLTLRNMPISNSMTEKQGFHDLPSGEDAPLRGDRNYASPWNDKIETPDDRSLGVSKNPLVVNSMMLQRSQTGINQIDQFAIHRSTSFGDKKRSPDFASRLDKDPHIDVYVREYSKGCDNPPFGFNSLKSSTVKLASREEDKHSRWGQSEHSRNAGDSTEVSNDISYNVPRGYNDVNKLDADEGRLTRRSDPSNSKDGMIFTKLRNLHKHSDDESNGLHNIEKYLIEGRERKIFSNSSENVYLMNSHYNYGGDGTSDYASQVRKKKNLTVDIGGMNKHTCDGVGFFDINNPDELHSFEKAHTGHSEKGGVMYRSVASNNSNAIIPSDGMTNVQMPERNGISFYSGPLVGRELIPVGNRSSVNKLGETADFGGKESSDLSDSRNTDNTIRIISTEGYISDRRGEIIDGRDLRQYWFDYINSSIGSVNANDIRGLIFGSSQGRIGSKAANNQMGPPSNQMQHSPCAVPGDVSTSRISEDALAQLIREKIKDSINDVVEKLLNERKNLDIVRKDLLNGVEKEPNASDASEGYNNGGEGSGVKNNRVSCSSSVKCEQGGVDQDVAPVKGVAKELRGKGSNPVCNDGVTRTAGEAPSRELDQEKGTTKIGRCSEEHQDEEHSAQGSQHLGRESNKETVHLDEEDMQEIEKLNNHLKLNKIKKSVNLQKEDKEKNQVKWKKLLYNCIDIIYSLTNENNAKNKKMNSLLGEINKLNEYEKKIEHLNEENEKLRVELMQKNELVKKKDIKERTNLNVKIADQAKKIANYEKDINIYKNKANKLNHKISNKDSEMDKLKKKYQLVLDEIEKCKQDATATLKQVLNKKHPTLVDKQCLDISKYYEVEMCMLNKQIRNLKDLLKTGTKEKIMLRKKLSECSEGRSLRGGHPGEHSKGHSNGKSHADSYSHSYADSSAHSGAHSSDDADGEESRRKAAPQKGNPTQTDTSEHTKEGTYKKMCQNLFNEMNEIKKNFDNQKILYDQKIEQLEQKQELQNMKNKLDASEKIVEVYQNIFRENVNYIKSDNLQKRDFSQPTGEMHSQGDGKSYGHLQSGEKDNLPKMVDAVSLAQHSNGGRSYDDFGKSSVALSRKDNPNSQMNATFTSCNMPGASAEFTMSRLQMGSESTGGHMLPPGVNSAAWGSVPSVSGIGMVGDLVSVDTRNPNANTQHNYLNDFVKMYLEKNPISESNNGFQISDLTKWNQRCTENVSNSEDKINHLHDTLMRFEKTELVNIFITICSELKSDNIFFVIQFVKFLSFIVYEQFPLFSSFFYNVASIISINSTKFDEYINVIKKWKSHYVNGQKYYLFRRSVLLIFQADLKDVRRRDIDGACLKLVRSLYEKNLEMSKYSNDSFEKAEYIINKHSKEIISKVIKTYMNLYSIAKISDIIPHMNSMNSKLKTQSYFVRSISSCLNLSKTDNFQEIERKIKELAATKGINEKIKNRINVNEIDEYLAAYTIMGTLKKYLNVTLTQDLLPSISKMIQKNRSSQ